MEQFKDKDCSITNAPHRSDLQKSFNEKGVHLSKREIGVLCEFYNNAVINFVDSPQFCTSINARMDQFFEGRAATYLVVNPIPTSGKEINQTEIEGPGKKNIRGSHGSMRKLWDIIRSAACDYDRRNDFETRCVYGVVP
jgi:hypothetical protein